LNFELCGLNSELWILYQNKEPSTKYKELSTKNQVQRTKYKEPSPKSRVLKTLTPRIRVLRGEFDNLFRSRNLQRQPPLELFITFECGMQQPAAGRQRHRSLSLFVETRADRSSFDAIFEKVFETLPSARLSEELVTHGNDIHFVQPYGDIQRGVRTIGRLSQHDLQCRGAAIMSVTVPTRR